MKLKQTNNAITKETKLMAKFDKEIIGKNGLEISDELPLSNYKNYGIYGECAHGHTTVINTSDLTRENWGFHYNCILNLLRDGIETDDIQ